MNISESIKFALDTVVVNKLRTTLTLLSIAIGVFAIMGSGTLVDSIDSAVAGELESMGEHSFIISKMPKIQTGGNNWRKYWRRKSITYSQYEEIKKELGSDVIVSGYAAGGGYTIEYGNNASDPDINIIGSDENFYQIQSTNVEEGRGITEFDVMFNRNVAVIGNDIVVECFPNINPIGKEIKIKHQKFLVIGVLESKGAMLGESQDNKVLIPMPQFLKYYSNFWNESLEIVVKLSNHIALLGTLDETIGILRVLRNLKPWQENDFELNTNEALTDQFSELTGFLTLFGAFSGLIALIAAGVGIMNIMLVSIKERTREIGVRKAVGAKSRWILLQIIIETVTLCQIGGAFGILLGTLASMILGTYAGVEMTIPVNWIILSIAICTLLGVVSGAYPAWRAARLDPIDALRYE